jgi:pterin-4a-carbinolamine dehydratase
VSIALTNHEAKGITQLDFDLAQMIDKLFEK